MGKVIQPSSLIITFAIIIVVGSTPISLTKQNFAQHFGCPLNDYQYCQKSPKRDSFIMFLMPWCGHCKKAKPQFENFYAYYNNEFLRNNSHLTPQQMDNAFQSALTIATVDCKDQQQICQYFDARRYPHFVYITSDKQVVYYLGPRTVESFMNFTKYHDPKIHQHAREGKMAHTIWHDVWDALKERWVQFLVLGVVTPSLVGYCLGNLIFNRKYSNKKTKNQGEKTSSQTKASQNKETLILNQKQKQSSKSQKNQDLQAKKQQ